MSENGTYEFKPGIVSYKVVQQANVIARVPPSLSGRRDYNVQHCVPHLARESILVAGKNGRVDLETQPSTYGLKDRLRDAWDLVRGKNLVKIGVPGKDEMMSDPAVAEYVGGHFEFLKALGKIPPAVVLEEKEFFVNASGAHEAPLEERV